MATVKVVLFAVTILQVWSSCDCQDGIIETKNKNEAKPRPHFEVVIDGNDKGSKEEYQKQVNTPEYGYRGSRWGKYWDNYDGKPNSYDFFYKVLIPWGLAHMGGEFGSEGPYNKGKSYGWNWGEKPQGIGKPDWISIGLQGNVPQSYREGNDYKLGETQFSGNPPYQWVRQWGENEGGNGEQWNGYAGKGTGANAFAKARADSGYRRKYNYPVYPAQNWREKPQGIGKPDWISIGGLQGNFPQSYREGNDYKLVETQFSGNPPYQWGENEGGNGEQWNGYAGKGTGANAFAKARADSGYRRKYNYPAYPPQWGKSYNENGKTNQGKGKGWEQKGGLKSEDPESNWKKYGYNYFLLPYMFSQWGSQPDNFDGKYENNWVGSGTGNPGPVKAQAAAAAAASAEGDTFAKASATARSGVEQGYFKLKPQGSGNWVY